MTLLHIEISHTRQWDLSEATRHCWQRENCFWRAACKPLQCPSDSNCGAWQTYQIRMQHHILADEHSDRNAKSKEKTWKNSVSLGGTVWNTHFGWTVECKRARVQSMAWIRFRFSRGPLYNRRPTRLWFRPSAAPLVTIAIQDMLQHGTFFGSQQFEFRTGMRKLRLSGYHPFAKLVGLFRWLVTSCMCHLNSLYHTVCHWVSKQVRHGIGMCRVKPPAQLQP